MNQPAPRKLLAALTGLMLFFALAPGPGAATVQEIRAWDRIPVGHPVMYEILCEALDQTVPEYGPYHITLVRNMEQGRVVAELARNKLVDVAVFAPTAEREAKLLPIRIPVTKGLLGLRVCLIREDDASLFQDIHTLEDWKDSGLTIGQGTHWPDTRILEANGLVVEKSTSYLPLFDMLANGRFDCFCRSVNEVLPELAEHGGKGLVLEPNLLFVYRLPTFFFVSPQNPRLAERIGLGLEKALHSGTFDKIFMQGYGQALEIVDLPSRKPIFLDNPFLTPETERILSDERLWYDPF